MITSNKGFTLVELLIVIAIIAILSSMSIIIYQKYQQKSLATSKLLPIAEGCSKEIIAYCIGLGVRSPTNIDVASLPLKNCQSTTVFEYSLTVNVVGSFVCNPGGSVEEGRVIAESQKIPDYKAECKLLSEGLKCSVISNNQ
ncbi:prepilin-type N-terminal cleavage/methylation domain-containing protein [Persephonella sp.]